MSLLTLPQFTLRDALKFTYRHRAGTQMVDWPLWHVFAMLRLYWNRGQLYVTSDDGSTISGIVIAVPQDSSTVRIEQIICTSTRAFKVLRQACRNTFPGADLVYFRNKYGQPRKLLARKI